MTTLAIEGGPKAAGELQLPPWPQFDSREEAALLRTLRSNRWCRLSGHEVETFERMFAEYVGATHAVAVSNGTVALELALAACEIRPGDEVIVPAVSFIASASTIVTSVRAVPIFADIDPQTAAIDPASLEAAITDRTKAVVVVHYGGYPVDFDRILPIVESRNLRLIEDCAHAQGTEWRGRKVGTIGDVGAFSFQESKSFTAGEGGAVVTNNDRLAQQARLHHNIGRVMGEPGYKHYALASNYRMSEFQGAILRVQLERYRESQVRIKHQRGKYLTEKLRDIGGVEPLKMDERITQRGYYFFVIRYNQKEFGNLSKDRFVEALRAEGVPCDTGYGIPLYKQPAFNKAEITRWLPESTKPWPDYEQTFCPAAERFCAEEQVTLPHQLLLLEESKLQLIVDAIDKIKNHFSKR